jgi:hypothetical protein
MGRLGLAIARFWITPPPAALCWFRLTATSNASWDNVPGAKVVILRACDYPTDTAAKVLRRNAIRIAELRGSVVQLIVLSK